MAGRELCNAWTPLLRLAQDAISVGCLRCRASSIHMSIVQVVQRLYSDLSEISVYETSSRGPLFEYLRGRAGRLTCSEWGCSVNGSRERRSASPIDPVADAPNKERVLAACSIRVYRG